MRITLLVLFCLSLNVHNIFGQAGYFPDERIISYSKTNSPLKEILIELSLKTDVNISFNERQVNKYQNITVVEHSKSLGFVLTKALDKTDLKYKLISDQIVIVRDFEDISKNQELITISGYITDTNSSEKLINATVYLPDYGIGTITNEYGFYSLNVPKKDVRVVVSYLGYDPYVVDQNFEKNQDLDINLSASVELEEVVITDQITTVTPGGDSLITSRQVNNINMLEILTNREIESMITMGGESDLIKRAQFSSGIHAGVDGFGGMFVRGGGKDQNLVLLDGIPIYNADHAFGIYSIFNTEVVKKAKLYKSGIPARYEGRLSSVLDIRTKDGNKNELAGNVTVGLLTAKASFEGPISKGKSSFLVSYRRSTIDPWIDVLADFIDERNEGGEKDRAETKFAFYDFNAKLNFKLSNKHRLYFSAYKGDDLFSRFTNVGDPLEDAKTSEDNIDWKWGNELAVVRLNSQLSNNMFLNTSVFYNNYNINSFDLNRFKNYDDEGDFLDEEHNFGFFDSNILDLGVKLDFDLVPSSSHFIKFGVSATRHEFRPRLLFYSTFVTNTGFVEPNTPITKGSVNEAVEETTISGDEILIYVEDEIELNRNLTLNVGINNSIILTPLKTYINPQPRISLKGQGKPINLFGSIGFYSQFVQALTNSGIGVPADLWLPTTSKLSPQKSYIFSAGFSSQSKKGTYFETELFYKKFIDIVAFNEGGIFNISQNSNWEESIPKGEGEAYGAEFNLKKTSGKTNWFANYTYSRTTRKFAEFNNGSSFPARYDTPHAVKLAIIHNFTPRFSCAINWIYSSGTRVTTPTEFIEVPLPNGTTDFILIYREKNNFKLPDYHKLDIGFTYTKLKHWGSYKFTFGATNVYNRQNPVITDIVRNSVDERLYDFQFISLFPVLPSLSYSISF